ncbi:MAG TPA: hypothetical protein VF883_00815, partial [Thermoanaerobaculia bacterium]
YATTVTYTLDVDAYGQLTVTMSPPTVTNNSQDIDVSTWDRLIGLGDVASMIRSMRSQLLAAVVSSTQGFEGEVASLLNGSGAWVYPGGKTFMFKEPSFSDFQDLITRVTYADPATILRQRTNAAIRRTNRRRPVAKVAR